MLANLSVCLETDVDHLELLHIPGITVSWVTDLSGKDYKETKFSGYIIKLDFDYSDVLGTEET